MSSRITDDVKELFICFCEVAQPEGSEKDGWVIQKYPDDYNDDEVLKTIPKFAYPCEFENSTVQHFSFVLTNIKSKWTFGFCRHDPKSTTALVFLSYLPWHEVFIRVLNTTAELIRSYEAEDLRGFLDYLKNSGVPEPGTELTIRLNEKLGKFVCTAPQGYRLPSIPENRNLTEYYSAVETSNMIAIFASMLQERRIIMKSRKLTRLSACVQAANTLLYPMSWQHIFIPLLPKHLTDYLLAPMPYLIGVPTPTWESVRSPEIGDVVVIDLDATSNQLDSRFHDAEKLPVEVARYLKSHLGNQSAMREDGFARTFLRALVRLIGGYRDALRFQQGEKITFNAEAFVESRPPSIQPFLREMLNLQIFRQFIEERLDILNAGLGFTDEFEFEANNYTSKPHSVINDQYQHWAAHMKKQGTAIFKTVKNKTNPAMKTAVRKVKESSKDVKSAYRDIKTRIRKDGQSGHFDSSSSTFHRTRPLTIGSPVVANSTFSKPRVMSSVVSSRSNEYVPLSSPIDELSSASPQEATPAIHSDMNLLADLEHVINQKCSLLDESPPIPDRTLKPARSLQPQQAEEPPVLLPPARISRTDHPRLNRPSWSIPLESPSPCSPFSFNFQNPSPFYTDPFGFMPSSTTVALENPGNPFLGLEMPLIPLPNSVNTQTRTDRQLNGSEDLIRLDSTSSQNENCLSHGSSDDSIVFKTGISNPLYPYTNITISPEKKPANGAIPFRSAVQALPPSNGILQPTPYRNNTSFVHSNPRTSVFNENDMKLLSEYGIDFDSNTSDVSGNNNNSQNQHIDPFELPFDSSAGKTPSTWTTFD